MKLLLSETIEGQDYLFDLYYIIVDEREVGTLVYRHAGEEDVYYEGHIGYHIDEEYRGNNYAYQACLLFQDIMPCSSCIITCSPDNTASLKTIEKLGCQYIETSPLPPSHKKKFTPNETIKRRYLLKKKGDCL